MNPLLNVLHLKFFRDAVLYNSISEAAKANFVTQSTVSQGISKLERILNIQLLVHARQKFQLTDEGKVVFEQIQHVFKSIQNIYDVINEFKEAISGNLKFVMTTSLGMSFIAPSYKKIKANLPQVEMNVKLGNLNYIRNAIKQGDAEFGIVVYDQDFSSFSKRLLKKGKFNLYQSIKKEDKETVDGVLIDFHEGMHVNDLRKYLARKGTVSITNELSSWEVVARFTELGMGIGFIPDYIMDNNRYPHVRIYPLKIPSFDYEICAIYKKGEKLSRAASAFIENFAADFL